MKKIKTETIRLDDKFDIMYINSVPPRIEAKLEFDKNHISQKLIFTLMKIAHFHGFGCSAPFFGEIQSQAMSFLIGTVVQSRRAIKKHLERMHACLNDLFMFVESFNRQLDFSTLDLSMLDGVFIGDVEKIAAVRDQHYDGSWDQLRDSLEEDGFPDAAEVAMRLKQFEEVNNKDIGFIGFKLNYVLNSLYSKIVEDQNKNTVFN